VCAAFKQVAIHIFEKQSKGFVRISTFGGEDEEVGKVVNVHYGGRVHYDALKV